jgi:hypothetical protein
MSERYLVWSNEHMAWWRPDSMGYTRNIANAGTYARSDAMEISQKASSHIDWTRQTPNELPVRVADLPESVRDLIEGE